MPSTYNRWTINVAEMIVKKIVHILFFGKQHSSKSSKVQSLKGSRM